MRHVKLRGLWTNVRKDLGSLSLKSRSHCAGTKKINQFFPSLSVVMEWVLYPIVMATATEKLGIMATGGGVHAVTAKATKGMEFFSPFRCRCRHSVNKPLVMP